MKSSLYFIKCITNLHVGSGDISFGVIDNLVQRDCITGLPVINASSLKGALREHFTDIKSEIVEALFGESNSDNPRQGSHKFFNANILVYPVRSNKKQFFRATSPAVIEHFLQTAEDFGIAIKTDQKEALNKMSNLDLQEKKPFIFENIQDVELEEFKAEYKNSTDVSKLSNLLGSDLALFNDDDFKNLVCGKNCLPVIARNYLENGISQNLWYEEIVPRESRFYFATSCLEEQTDFESLLLQNNIQIGANATIGYGLTSIYKVEVQK